jgi:hypothetical protein
MADGSADALPTRGIRTICVPAEEEVYAKVVQDAAQFRVWLQEIYGRCPELFPSGFELGFELKDIRHSKKSAIWLRRIRLRTGKSYSVRPSFVMPYMTAMAADVENGLFLRKFGVPFWAVAHVMGRDAMFWFRQECALGRNSIVGATVRQVEIPEHLAADEHHQTLNGNKVFVATTVAEGCILGAAVAQTASIEDLSKGYGVFRGEARDVDPEYEPQTVNTDGWKGTRGALKALFPTIVLLRCFLHAWIKIRDRGKNLKETFFELGERVWDVYRAPSKRSCSQRIRRLQDWAQKTLTGVILTETLDLCRKKQFWLEAYDHPEGHRTSNMLDRSMRPMNRYFFNCQHLHGKGKSTTRHIRGWVLISNFAPWNPAVIKTNAGWQSPAERLNKHRYHSNWLQNLMISASMAGYRNSPQKA